jgi:hypothetical protein
VVLASEVIPVGFLARPPSLAGGPAGRSAARFAAELLVSGVAVIRNEEFLAASAFAVSPFARHARQIGEEKTEIKPDSEQRKKSQF